MSNKVVRITPNNWFADNSGTDEAGNSHLVVVANEEGGFLRVLTMQPNEPMARQRAEEHMMRHRMGVAMVLELKASYQPAFKVEEVEVETP